MKKIDSTLQYGIYADHKKAFILTMDKNDTIACEEIMSGIITRPRVPGEKSNKISVSGHTINRQRKTQNREHGELKKYYEKILDDIKHPNSILFFGPAQAKNQLFHFVQRVRKLPYVFSYVETVDSMNKKEAIVFFEKNVLKN